MIRRKVIPVIILTVASSVLTGVVQAEEYNVNPGMWETTSKMKVTGMPPEMAAMMQKPQTVEKECVKDNSYDFNPGEGEKGCSIKKNRQSSKHLSWEMVCNTEGGGAKGKGEANFNGDSVSGWFEMDMQGPAGPMKIRHDFNAKRTGSC